MRLISCYIDGFGKLNNMEVQFEDGINTFVQDNGWGKSTLAALSGSCCMASTVRRREMTLRMKEKISSVVGGCLWRRTGI